VNISPLDDAGYPDRVLMAEIGKLNEQLGHYILRYLAADALQAEPISVSEEQGLANTMTTLATKVRARANRRAVSATAPVLDGGATLKRLAAGRPSDADH
jgi:hypothetical protein